MTLLLNERMLGDEAVRAKRGSIAKAIEDESILQ
jgi:hypothetical protein